MQQAIVVDVFSDDAAKSCARCGRGFVGRSDAQTCSNACRQWLYRNRDSLRVKCNAA
jgi:predicted nucleic acid-binding Zn ribbon protein